MNLHIGHIDVTPASDALTIEKSARRRRRLKLEPPKTLDRDSWPPDYAAISAWRSEQLKKLESDKEFLKAARYHYKNSPSGCIDFINDWCDTWDTRNTASDTPVRMPFILFVKQEELVDFVLACLKGDANGLIEKSRDMGATWVCVAVSVWLWLFWPGSSVGWGSNKASKVDRLGDPSTIFEKIRLLINSLPDVFKPKGLKADKHLLSGRILNPENGASIVGEGGDSIGRGGRTRVYFVDEAAHLARPETVAASLSETTRVRIDLSSVSGLGSVFHRTRQAGQVWERGGPVRRDCANVLIMDWRDHPAKTQEWYENRVKDYESRGLAHIVAREIDRNYAASQEGVIIPYAWAVAAEDAHLKLGWELQDAWHWHAGLDVADGGMDANSLSRRKGPVLYTNAVWAERDTGVTTRKAVAACRQGLPCHLQYDAIGVGSGIKAEANRLKEDEDLIPEGLFFVAWNAGAAVLNPGDHIIPNDVTSQFVRDFYKNLKAQAWWELRTRFYKTFMAITKGAQYPIEEMISLCTKTLGQSLRPLQEELAQATYAHDSKMKIIVNKAPEGTRSPNRADATVMAFWPLPSRIQGIFVGPSAVALNQG